MPNILIKAADLYLAKVQVLLNENATVADHAMHGIFPAFGEKEVQHISELAKSLTTLVPALTRFLSDRKNLFNDRALASSIVCYLISPFDIIPDEHGLVGTIDDALIAFQLAAQLEQPSDEIIQLINKNNQLVSAAYEMLPEWARESISNVIQLTIQQQDGLSGIHDGKGI